MKHFQIYLLIPLIMLSVVFSVFSSELNSADITHQSGESKQPSFSSSNNDPYTGKLRIYMNEPISRYKDDTNHDYEFGFLDFAAVLDISVNYGEIWESTFLWDANLAGFGDITEDNIKATVVLFDDEYTVGDARPPYNYFFLAYFAEAAAGATVGTYGQNQTDGAFSHTVFIEELTATY